ncbi:TonB-dependent receptor [Solimonas marina]|uniref:TonB-dependent receptor n=1 Tax=Solimonas marina TaxID=2714601 RepID=A0A969WBB6_9GAMM|nr:TonB-dependent receptor [Solimonas marina]NKF22878.1 TonB-dependent receptor [Solimonas marina]
MPALFADVRRARTPLPFAPSGAAALSLKPLMLAAMAFPALAFADADVRDRDENAPAEIVVTASPLGRTSDELVQPVDVLSGADLDRARRGTLGETLEGQPGVSTTDFGAGAGRPVIRGLAGPRVEMLENGLSVMDVSDLSPDHNVTIAPAQARQIEILKGPATLLYGNSASGGVVNVDNGRLPTAVADGLHGALDTSYGSNGDAGSVSGELNYGTGGHMLHADYGFREAEDYDIPGYAGVDHSGSHDTLDNSQLRAQSGALSYAYVDGNGDVFGFSGNRFVTNYGLPVEETAFISLHQTRLDTQIILNKPIEGLESIKFRAGSSLYDHTEFEAKGEPGTVFHNQQYQGRLEAVHVPVAGFRGVVGVQFNWRDFSALGEEAYVPPVYSRQAGLFFMEEKPYSLGKLEFGARIERDTNTPAGGYPDRNYTPFSASLGSIFNVGDTSHLKLYATHAERSPVPEELYAFGPHGATATFERGSVDAKTEDSNNVEVGFDHHGDGWTFNGSVYYNDIRHYLYLSEVDEGLNADGSGTPSSDGVADRVDEEGEFDPDGNLVLADYRQANARLYGFEAALNVMLIRNGPFKLNSKLFGDYVRAKLSGGENLPRIPPLRVGLAFDGSYGRAEGGLRYTFVDHQNDNAPLETKTSGYRLLDADLSYKLYVGADGEHSASVYLRGSNLLNDDIRRSTSFVKDSVPAPGRSVYVGFRMSL